MQYMENENTHTHAHTYAKQALLLEGVGSGRKIVGGGGVHSALELVVDNVKLCSSSSPRPSRHVWHVACSSCLMFHLSSKIEKLRKSQNFFRVLSHLLSCSLRHGRGCGKGEGKGEAYTATTFVAIKKFLTSQKNSPQNSTLSRERDWQD